VDRRGVMWPKVDRREQNGLVDIVQMFSSTKGSTK
jgi:hypothetical protein